MQFYASFSPKMSPTIKLPTSGRFASTGATDFVASPAKLKNSTVQSTILPGFSMSMPLKAKAKSAMIKKLRSPLSVFVVFLNAYPIRKPPNPPRASSNTIGAAISLILSTLYIF